MKKKLFFFTNSFPYGIGEMWKANELKCFVNFFSEITVVPYTYGGNFDNPKALPPGVKCTQPLIREENTPNELHNIFKLLFDRNVIYYLREFFRKKIYRNRQWLTPWLTTSLETQQMLDNPVIKEIFLKADKNSVFYFYWGKGSSFIVPFLDRKKVSKIVVRFHRFDLFEYENNGYIPYRIPLFKSATLLAPSSQNGLDYLRSLYPVPAFPMKVVRCGVIGDGLSRSSNDGVLRIISCSHVVPVKRIHIIAEALNLLDFPVEWTHLGDGYLMSEIRKISSGMRSNIGINFPGYILSTDVLTYYKSHPVDLFINVSSSEGVPFSIMEAFSAGIPVFATRVGGTGEIVDDTVGKILSPGVTPEALAISIREFSNLTPSQREDIRKRAYKRYEERCNAIHLTEEFAKYLVQ